MFGGECALTRPMLFNHVASNYLLSVDPILLLAGGFFKDVTSGETWSILQHSGKQHGNGTWILLKNEQHTLNYVRLHTVVAKPNCFTCGNSLSRFAIVRGAIHHRAAKFPEWQWPNNPSTDGSPPVWKPRWTVTVSSTLATKG